MATEKLGKIGDYKATNITGAGKYVPFVLALTGSRSKFA